MSHQKTKGSPEKPKVSSLREKPKASRVHRDHMGHAQLYGIGRVFFSRFTLFNVLHSIRFVDGSEQFSDLGVISRRTHEK